MKMAKANENDLAMANELARLLQDLEHGSFPINPDDESEDVERFDCDNAEHCRRAMEMILNTLQGGSLFRVTFGMLVLLDPTNEMVDPELSYLDHHPKTRRARDMHDELVRALRLLREECRHVHAGVSIEDELQLADAVLAKVEGSA